MPVEYWGCGVRHVQTLLMVLCGVVELSMLQTVRISIFLVDRIAQNNYTLFDDPYKQIVKSWTMQQKSILINAWFMLAFIGALLGGYLTLKVNLKYLLLGIIVAISILTYIVPYSVIYGGYDVLLVVLLFTGIFHGMKEPVMIGLLARWIPSLELGRAIPVVFTSFVWSNICGLLVYTFLKDSSSSWTSVYYLMGNSGILWCVGWFAFGSPNPDKCFFISAKERMYITKNLELNEKKQYSIPWTSLLKSVPFYGVFISNVLYRWVFTTLLYSNYIQNYFFALTIEYTFQLFGSAMLIIVMIPLIQIGTGIAGDMLTVNKRYPPRFVRKTLNSIAMWGTCSSCLIMAYNKPPFVDVMNYVLYCHMGCMIYQGSQCNFFDGERRLSGFLSGVVNFFALIPMAFINNYTQPVLLQLSNYTKELDDAFDTVWYTGALTSFIGNFFYIIMAGDDSIPMVPLPTSEPSAKSQ